MLSYESQTFTEHLVRDALSKFYDLGYDKEKIRLIQVRIDRHGNHDMHGPRVETITVKESSKAGDIVKIGGIKYKVGELVQFKDDIERFIIYTCYITRTDINFKFLLYSMIKYNISSYNPENSIDHVMPDKIDMEIIRNFNLERLNEIVKENEKIYIETEDSLYAHTIEELGEKGNQGELHF